MRYLEGARALSTFGFIGESCFSVSLAVLSRHLARVKILLGASALFKLVDRVGKLQACFGVQIPCD